MCEITSKTLQELCLSDSLSDVNEKVTPFVYVEHFKKLRCCAYSDTIVIVTYEWSFDGQEKAVTTTFRCPVDLYKLDTTEVLLPYVRLRILNTGVNKNKKFRLFASGYGKNKALDFVIKDPERPELPVIELPSPAVVCECPEVHVPEPEPEVKEVKEETPVYEVILPKNVPPASILITDLNGKLVALPIGKMGEFLRVGTNGLPTWSEQL